MASTMSVSPGWVPFASSPSGGSPKSASGCNSDSFQVTAAALGLGICESLHVPFRNRVSVSYSPPALLYTNPASLQSQTFWGLVFLVQYPRLGSPMWGLNPLAPWVEFLQLWLSSLFVGHLPRGVGVDYSASLSLPPILLWFLLYIFKCGRSLLPVFSLFS